MASCRQLLCRTQHIVIDIERRPHDRIITHHASDVKKRLVRHEALFHLTSYLTANVQTETSGSTTVRRNGRAAARGHQQRGSRRGDPLVAARRQWRRPGNNGSGPAPRSCPVALSEL